jgi:hypothetical protein
MVGWNYSTLTGAKPMKSIKWIIGVSICAWIGIYLYTELGIFWTVSIFTCTTLAMFALFQYEKNNDLWVQCKYLHWHIKGKECPNCIQRSLGRAIRKV